MTRLGKRWHGLAMGIGLAALLAAGRPAATFGEGGGHEDAVPVLRPGETMTGIYVMSGTVAAEHTTVGYINAQINFPRQVRDQEHYQFEIIQLACSPEPKPGQSPSLEEMQHFRGAAGGALVPNSCFTQPTEHCPGFRQAVPGFI
jgi:hypothetical protein